MIKSMTRGYATFFTENKRMNNSLSLVFTHNKTMNNPLNFGRCFENVLYMI